LQSIFLTGSNGFLGKHIHKHFSLKYRIVAPTRHELDLTNTSDVNHYFSLCDPVDFFINSAHAGVAKSSIKLEKDYLNENLTLFKNVFNYGKNAKKFIQLGSGAEYSKPFYKDNMQEEDAGIFRPTDSYGLSKFFIGQLLEQQHTGRYVNLRLFGVFGPGEDFKTRFISNAIVRSLLNLPIIINQNSIFDYTYIDDFLKILYFFIGNHTQHISYNITSGEPISLIEIAQIVHDLTNNPYDLIIKNNLIKENYTGSNERLIKFLPKNFTFTPINSAIEKLIHWYDQYLFQLNRDDLDFLKKMSGT
jgi:UDP-glucose 4-epimerase